MGLSVNFGIPIISNTPLVVVGVLPASPRAALLPRRQPPENGEGGPLLSLRQLPEGWEGGLDPGQGGHWSPVAEEG